MKNNKGLFGIISIILGLLLLSRCSDVLNLQKSAESAGETVTISINEAGRTLLPGVPSFEKYVLTFTANAGQTAPAVNPVELENTSQYTLVLEPGSWTLNVIGMIYIENIPGIDDGYYEAASSGPVPFTVGSGGSNSLAVTVRGGIQEGVKGLFSWDISFPNEVIAATLEILDLEEDPIDGIEAVNLMEEENRIGTIALNPGYYFIKVELENEDNNKAYKADFFHIHSNLTTSADSSNGYAFTSANFAPMVTLNGQVLLLVLQGLDPQGTISLYRDDAYTHLIDSTAIDEDGFWSLRISALYNNVYLKAEVEYSEFELEKKKGPIAVTSTNEEDWIIDAASFDVNFEADGGTPAPDQRTVAGGSEITEPEAMTKDNYLFGGWFKEAAFENEWGFTTDIVTSDITLYAKWTRQYTVNFEADDGIPAPDQRTVSVGSEITEPEAMTKDGYIFHGWFTDGGIEWDFETPITGNITLYARWETFPIPYIITSSDSMFVATIRNRTVGTVAQPIQIVIDVIKTDAASADVAIQFGNGTDTLNIGTASVSFNNDVDTWGLVMLRGSISSSNSSDTAGTIVVADAVSINSVANIANTSTGRAINHTGTGTVNIASGTVLASGGAAIYNVSNGKITISQAAPGTPTTITSTNVADTSGTIVLAGTGVQLEMTGGTVQNTATSNPPWTYAPDAITIRNNSSGTVSISGGTVSATEGRAIHNVSNGKITVSGTALITSACTGLEFGTIVNNAGGGIEITGGTVQNTSDYIGTSISAIRNSSTGTINISGGTVSANRLTIFNINGTIIVSGTAMITNNGLNSGDVAIVNGSGGSSQAQINGGTVRAEMQAIRHISSGALTIFGGRIEGPIVGNLNGLILVSGTSTITSASASTISYSNIYATAANVWLEITGGTVENTSSNVNARAIYNNSVGTINISGGTVSATVGRAIQNDFTGKITVSGSALVTSANETSTAGTIFNNEGGQIEITGGTVRNTAINNANARAIYNNSTGTTVISGGTVGAMDATGAGTTGVAIWNQAGGAITISGTLTRIISANATAAVGTIRINSALGTLTVSGGTVENTRTSSPNAAITRATGATVNITGGTVIPEFIP